MYNTKIISGFPGIGKSYLFNNNKNLKILDSDSSLFSRIKDKDGNITDKRNPSFPYNYIHHIKDNIGKVDIILVSSHKTIRDALKKHKLNYILVYPDESLLYEYLIRYCKRNNNEKFIKFIGENWNNFISDIENETYPTKLRLWKNEYLSDIFTKTYCPIYEEFCTVDKTYADEYEGNPCTRCNNAKCLLTNNHTNKKVFLGGTCNESSWRNDLIKLLKIDYFNPIVEDWTEECMIEERKQRKTCNYVLYTITPKMTGTYSIAEVIDDSNKRPKKTLFCILEKDEDKSFTKEQLKSLNQVSEMVTRNGGKTFISLYSVSEYLNSKI